MPLCLILVGSLEATVYRVNPASAAPRDGLSWNNGFLTLQDALAAATTGDEIWVMAGTHYPDEGSGQIDNKRSSNFAIKADVAVYGGFAGWEVSLTQRDPDLNPTILSGELQQNGDNTDNSYQVVTATTVNAGTRLDGFVITGGCANGATSPLNRGGGIYMTGPTMQIRNCRIIGNKALLGGGIFANSADLEDCVIESNTADINGGGIHFLNATQSFRRVSFRGNYAANAGGGLFHNGAGTTAVAIDCEFIGNASGNVGGAVSNGNGSPGYLNCSMQGNSAVGSGGAVANYGTFSPSFTNTVIWNNLAGVSPSELSSVANDSGTTPVFLGCLVQHIDLTTSGSGNLDGTDAANDPLFAQALDPTLAPQVDGDLRPGRGSPILDRGDPAASSSTTDIAGRPRISNGDGVGTAKIDIGAHERPLVAYVREGGTGDGSSWASAFGTLAEGFSAVAGGGEVWVAAGTYYPDELSAGDPTASFRPGAGVAVYGGFAGTETSLSQRDLTGPPTILSGDIDQDGTSAGNAKRVVALDSFAGPSTLDGLTIRNGNADLASGANDVGGGVLIISPDHLVRNCIIEGNGAASKGGGAHLFGADRTRFVNTVFSGNRSADKGGGVFLDQSDEIRFINATFQGNFGTTGGGAINSENSSCAFINTLIWGNRSGPAVPPERWSIRDTGGIDYSHCLVEYRNLTSVTPGALGNLDGANPANDPLFVAGVDATSGPVTGALLRLQLGSPAIDAGNGAPAESSEDAGGLKRVDDGDFDGLARIDIGAFERSAPIYVDADALGTPADGSTWDRAFRNLQDGLATVRSGMEIWVAQGTYRPDEGQGLTAGDRAASFVVEPGVTLLGGFSGGEVSSSLRDPFTNETILSGNVGDPSASSDNSYRVVRVGGIAAGGVIDGFTIQEGYGSGAGDVERRGAGVFVAMNASPSLSNLRIKGNYAQDEGGGLYLNTGAAPQVWNVAFSGNRAGTGGGISTGKGSGAEFSNCSLQGNAATTRGGAIATGTTGPMTFRNCVAWNNAFGSSTKVASASLSEVSSVGIFVHCLLENLVPTGNGNLNGRTPTRAPTFLNPASAAATNPQIDGDLRLADLSDLINAGTNSASQSSLDLAGAERIQEDIIDIGAYEGIPNPNLQFIDHTDTYLPRNNSLVDLGYAPAKASGFSFIFRVINRGRLPLNQVSLNKSGPDAADVTITNGLSPSIASLQEDIIVIGIATSVAESRWQTATLKIGSNDPLNPLYTVSLRWIIASSTLDADNDGLDDLTELEDGNNGTNIFRFDTDGDGVGDGTEANLAQVGFVNGSDNSGLLSLLQANGIGLGLYTESNLRSLAVGKPVISRNPSTGRFILSPEILASPDLSSGFVPFSDYTVSKPTGSSKLNIEFDPPDPDAYFFQLELGE